MVGDDHNPVEAVAGVPVASAPLCRYGNLLDAREQEAALARGGLAGNGVPAISACVGDKACEKVASNTCDCRPGFDARMDRFEQLIARIAEQVPVGATTEVPPLADNGNRGTDGEVHNGRGSTPAGAAAEPCLHVHMIMNPNCRMRWGCASAGPATENLPVSDGGTCDNAGIRSSQLQQQWQQRRRSSSAGEQSAAIQTGLGGETSGTSAISAYRQEQRGYDADGTENAVGWTNGTSIEATMSNLPGRDELQLSEELVQRTVVLENLSVDANWQEIVDFVNSAMCTAMALDAPDQVVDWQSDQAKNCTVGVEDRGEDCGAALPDTRGRQPGHGTFDGPIRVRGGASVLARRPKNFAETGAVGEAE